MTQNTKITIPSPADVHTFLKMLLETTPQFRLEGDYALGNTQYSIDESFGTKDEIDEHFHNEIFAPIQEHINETMCNDPEVKEACIEEWNDYTDEKPWNELDEDEQEEALDEYVVENYCDSNSIDEHIQLHWYDLHEVLKACLVECDDEDDEVELLEEDDECNEYLSDGLIKFDDGRVGVIVGEPKLELVLPRVDKDIFYGTSHTINPEVALILDVLIDGNIVKHTAWSQDWEVLFDGTFHKANFSSCM